MSLSDLDKRLKKWHEFINGDKSHKDEILFYAPYIPLTCVSLQPLEETYGTTSALEVGSTGKLKSSGREWVITKKAGDDVSFRYKNERHEYTHNQYDLIKESKDVINNYNYKNIETPVANNDTGTGNGGYGNQSPPSDLYGFGGVYDDDLDKDDDEPSPLWWKPVGVISIKK